MKHDRIISKVNRGIIHKVHFDSVQEQMEWACDYDAPRWNQKQSKSKGQKDFYGTSNIEETYELVKTGWAKGRDHMFEVVDAINLQKNISDAPSPTYDVAGGFPIIPLAVSGDPFNMYDPTPMDDKKRPVLRVLVNTSANCNWTSKELMNRGAAILSVIDSIENMGTSIELAVTNTSRSQGVYIQTQTLVKRSGEHIDFDAIAFASAHPSMFRRIGFATWERVVEDGCEDKFKWAYGQSCDCQLLEMDQIYVPSFEGCGISQNVINKGGVPLYEAVLKGFNFLQDGLTFTGKTITETTYDYHE